MSHYQNPSVAPPDPHPAIAIKSMCVGLLCLLVSGIQAQLYRRQSAPIRACMCDSILNCAYVLRRILLLLHADVVRHVNNIQALFGLPYVPQPLISKWLPWVELFYGGSEFIFQNLVWPGKIVSYALDLEVRIRVWYVG